MGFHRQEYWSGLPFLPQGNLANTGIKPMSPALAGRFFTTEPPGKPLKHGNVHLSFSVQFSHSIVSDSLQPHSSSVHRISQARTLGGLPFPSPGDLPDPGIEPRSPALHADSLPTGQQGKTYWWSGNRVVFQESCVQPQITILYLSGGFSFCRRTQRCIVMLIPWGGIRFDCFSFVSACLHFPD